MRLRARTSTRWLEDLQVWRREREGKWMFIRGVHYPDSVTTSTTSPGQ